MISLVILGCIKGGDFKMIRGTTPTLKFGLPFEVSLIEKASIALSQNGSVIIDKSLDDCEVEEKTLILKLSQSETLKLRSETDTEIQVRIRTHDGTALASEIIVEDTDRILKDGEI